MRAGGRGGRDGARGRLLRESVAIPGYPAARAGAVNFAWWRGLRRGNSPGWEHGRATGFLHLGRRTSAGARGSAMPQWTLFESDFKLIDDVLDELLQRTNALSAHLIDRSGQVITSAGRADDFDVPSFASLAAAAFTANA